MRCGLSLGARHRWCGFGLPWNAKRVKLWAWHAGIVPPLPVVACGNRCQRTIANEPSSTRTNMMHILASCRPSAIAQCRKRQAKPTILNVSITPCANGVPTWSVRRSRSVNRQGYTEYGSGWSLITTISILPLPWQYDLNHYPDFLRIAGQTRKISPQPNETGRFLDVHLLGCRLLA